MRCRHVLGFDADGNDACAVEMALLREGPVLKGARYLDAAALPEELARMAGDTMTRYAAAAIPYYGALHRWLDLPRLGPAETGAAALAAMEDQVPFPPGEICLGWQRPGKEGRVQVAAAKRGPVEQVRAGLQASGLRPIRLDLRPLAAATAFWHGFGSDPANRTAVLVELRADESSVVFMHAGEILYARVLPGLAGDSQTRLAELAGDLRSTGALLRTWPDWEEPDCLWLAGTLASRAEIRCTLAELLGQDPATLRVAKPLGLLRPAGVAELGPEWLVPVGLCLAALGLESLGPDLQPGLARTQTTGHSPLPLILPAGLAFVLAMGGFRLMAETRTRRNTAAEAWMAANRGEIEALRALDAETQALTLRQETLDTAGDGGRAYLDLLAALDKALPPGTQLTRLSLSVRRVETMDGTTPSVSALLQRLRRDPVLSGLYLRGQAVARTVEGRKIEAFTLAGPFGPKGGRP